MAEVSYSSETLSSLELLEGIIAVRTGANRELNTTGDAKAL